MDGLQFLWQPWCDIDLDTMAGFQDLPLELIHEILEEAYWIGALVSLSRCCKLLHTLAEPLIYDHILLNISCGTLRSGISRAHLAILDSDSEH